MTWRAISARPYGKGSGAAGGDGDGDGEAVDPRVVSTANFQTMALLHALKFPAAERVSYSTCSVHALENELVVKEVLPEAERLGYSLEVVMPGWHRRGLPGLVGPGRYCPPRRPTHFEPSCLESNGIL